MTGVSIDFQIDDKAVSKAFTRLVSVMGNTTPIMSAIGTGLVGSTHRRFVSQRAPDGTPWERLHSEYTKMKRNRRILTESGRLRDSISSRPGRDQVTVGTNTIYAAVHQLGSTIKPKAASHLVFRLASGIVLSKSVTIPSRPYLGISDDDHTMISETVFHFIQRYT